jgi:beta-galactosidase
MKPIYNLLYTLFLFCCFVNVSNAKPGFGIPVNINQDWYFKLSDIKDGQQIKQFDRSFQRLDLPHDWTVKQTLNPSLASATGYLPGGVGWYYKVVNIPKEDTGKKMFVYFEGVYNRSDVYINGQPLGHRPNGYVSFMYDLTQHIKYGADNVIAVRVDHSQDADSRWYTGSGIYRDVYLVKSEALHIDLWGVYCYPEINKNAGALQVELNLVNELSQNKNVKVQYELIDPQGKVVTKNSSSYSLKANDKATFKSQLKVNKPQLWSLESPVLYQLKTKIYDKDRLIDSTTVKTGFRKFTFDPNKGFALNDKWMKMKGICFHHDAGVLGAEVYREVWKRRLLNLKEIGVNAVRTSHNPQASIVYELCDELGLLVLNEAFDEWEFPKRKWLQGWNVGTPGFQGMYDFFEKWGEEDLTSIVRRDRNHLSIFAWSIGNEVDYPNDPYSHPILNGDKNQGFTQAIYGGYKKDAPDAMRLGVIAKRLAAVVKKYDLSRPVTAGLAGVAMSNETEYPGALDIAGYNYTESKYHEDHKKYPNRIIYGSENRHDLEAWKAVADNEFIFGQFLWTGIDYLGESGRWPSRGFYSGLLDLGGYIKPRGYFRQSLWSDKPMIYIGTYPLSGGNWDNNTSVLEVNERRRNEQPSIDAWPVWNYQANQLIRVVAYTNANQAYLELNGKQVGEKKSDKGKYGVLYWDIPYAVGKLEAVGLDANGKEISRHLVQSSNRPHTITVNEEQMTISQNGEVGQIEVQIVDEDGVPVLLSEDEITFESSRNIRLLGMEGGNNSDMTNYTDNRHRVFRGRMIIYFKANNANEQEGKIVLKSDWLKSKEIKVTFK